MVVNFVPDGKTKGMSVLNHQVDAAETAKGKPGTEGAGGKQKAATGPDGKLSKKALAKLQKKEAKTAKKSGGAAAADDGKKKEGKAKNEGDKKPKAAVSTSKASSSDVFSGAAADLWEGLLATHQWFGGLKPSKADAQAAKLMGSQMPDPERHPNLFGWASMAKKFQEVATKNWAEGELQMPAGGMGPATSAAEEIPAKKSHFSGACANLWEQMLSSSGSQWLLGDKPTQADTQAGK